MLKSVPKYCVTIVEEDEYRTILWEDVLDEFYYCTVIRKSDHLVELLIDTPEGDIILRKIMSMKTNFNVDLPSVEDIQTWQNHCMNVVSDPEYLPLFDEV